MKQNWWKAIASFLMVLFTMPLGHALMMIMEKTMAPEALHYSAFLMGLVTAWGSPSRNSYVRCRILHNR